MRGEFRIGTEQLRITGTTCINTGRDCVGVFTCEWCLRPRFAEHVILLGIEACTPLVLISGHGIGRTVGSTRAISCGR